MSRIRARCIANGHRERQVERLRALVGVVRIHDQRFGELTRRAGELAEQEHAAFIVARGDELLRDEIHPVVQAADEAEIGRAIVLVDLVGIVVLDEQHDGRRAPVRELAR